MSRIRQTILKNGIKVVTEELPDVESSSIGVWVATGSRKETRRVNGITHFIEHLLFKGTKRRTALDIAKEIESVGGVLNAFTSREYTCFYAKVINKDLPRAVDLLSDIFMNSLFDPAEIDKERMVVLQEIKMIQDTPDDLIHDIFAESFWKDHPLGRPVVGDMQTVASLKRRDILTYFRRNYRSNTVFVTAAGGLGHRRLVRLLDATFGTITPGISSDNTKSPVPASGVRLIHRDLEQVHLCIGVPVPPQPSKERYALYLLHTVLGGGMSSRLFQEVREKRGLAYSIYTYLSLCKDAGSLVAYAGTSEGDFTKVVDVILKEFDRLPETLTREELENAKEQMKGGMLLGLETSDSRMTKLARDVLYFGRIIPIKEIVKSIDGVKLDEVRKLAAEIFDPGRVALTAIGRVRKKGLPKELKNLV